MVENSSFSSPSTQATTSQTTAFSTDDHDQNRSLTKASPGAAAALSSQDNGHGSRRGRQMTRDMSASGRSNNPLSMESLRRRGYHTLLSSYKPFHVQNRWRLVRELGQGAYGMVVSAEDKLSGETVAIKMVTRVFDKLQLAKRALREITLLRHFSTRGHENVTGLIDLDAVHPDFSEIYIFMEPMEADLYQIMRSGQHLTNEHVQYFLYQILRGVKFIHTASVIHRDLKPGNLLVNADCELKVCDFGLANTFEGVNQLTEYVATRWYRAPEIMLSFRTYTTAIDVWSIGCILAELLLGTPLFRGKDYVDQLNRILDVLGTPDETVFNRICSEKAKAYVRSLPIRKPQPFSKIFPKADAQVLDLLSKMITWDPDQRLTVIEALEHPWLANYHDPTDEPACPTKFERYKEYEDLTTLEEFRTAIWNEIVDFRQEVRTLHPRNGQSISKPEEHHSGNSQRDGATDSKPTSPIAENISNESTTNTTGVSSDVRVEDAVQDPVGPTILPPSSPSIAQAEADDLPPPVQRDPSTLVGTTDPIASYRRRSSVLQPGFSPHVHSRGPSQAQHQTFPPSGQNDSAGEGSYIVPARSRATSMMGGQSQLLRTLSTFSIHEKVDSDLSKLLAGQKTAADAPPSSIPREFVSTDKERPKH